jgi:hypothetical protein
VVSNPRRRTNSPQSARWLREYIATRSCDQPRRHRVVAPGAVRGVASHREQGVESVEVVGHLDVFAVALAQDDPQGGRGFVHGSWSR